MLRMKFFQELALWLAQYVTCNGGKNWWASKEIVISSIPTYVEHTYHPFDEIGIVMSRGVGHVLSSHDRDKKIYKFQKLAITK